MQASANPKRSALLSHCALLLMLISLLPFSSCRSPDGSRRLGLFNFAAKEPPPLEFVEDEDEMLQRVLTYVPPGTSFVQAEKLMKAAGCTCSFREDEDGPYLYCHFTKSVALMVVKDWGVYIHIVDGRVNWVTVSFGYVGV